MTESDWLLELAIDGTLRAMDSVRAVLEQASEVLEFHLRAIPGPGGILIGAQSERQIAAAVFHLRSAVADGYRLGNVQAAYRITPAGPANATYTHKRQAGGSGEFAEVKLRLQPGGRGSGFQFFDDQSKRHIRAEWIPSVEKGIRQAAETGGPFDVPMIDFSVHLLDGKFHDLDSSALAFELAGAGALREAALGAGIKLLEPVVKVAVPAPAQWLDAIVAELERRDANIDEVKRGPTGVIVAIARVADMLGFDQVLRSKTGASAAAAMVLHGYEEMPGDPGPDDSQPIAAALRA
jgi:elongation factor G